MEMEYKEEIIKGARDKSYLTFKWNNSKKPTLVF